MRTDFVWDVFLSWTSEDLQLMQRIKEELCNYTYTGVDGTARKLRVYSSHEHCIDEFVNNLDENIDESCIVVPIVTENFNKKETGWCLDELTRAKSNHNNPEFKQSIIPFIVDAPTKGYKLILEPISAVWKINSPNDGDGFAESIAQLKSKIYFALKSRETKNATFLNIYNSVYRIVSDVGYYQKMDKPLGRENDLINFEHFVESNAISIINCGAGIGKTKFVRYFISLQAEQGADVAMITAHNKTLNEALLDISFEQETPPPDFSLSQKINWIKSKLQKIENRTLIVFDGLSNDGIYNALQMNFGDNVKIIITSNGYDGEGAIYQLSLLSEDTLCDMFYDIYSAEPRESTERSVRDIIRLVEKHTMTITLIARILQASKRLLTVEKIRDKISKGELLDIRQRCFVQSDESNGVSATIREILQQLFDISVISDNNASKTDLLRFLFFIPGEGIDLQVLANYVEIDDAVIIDELYSTGWLDKSESGALGLHIIVKLLVKYNLLADGISKETTQSINKFFLDNITHNSFDSRSATLQKLKYSLSMLDGVKQFDNEVLKAEHLLNLAKLNDILGNYDLALNNVTETEKIYVKFLPDNCEKYLECRNLRLLLYTMRLRNHPEITRFVAEYMGVDATMFTKEQLFYNLSWSIIEECEKFGYNVGEVLGFCYRTCADQLMVMDLRNEKIEIFLDKSYKSREAVKSLFWFETIDTLGYYNLLQATEYKGKDQERELKYLNKAEEYYLQAYKCKQSIGKENGVEDGFNPFIGTSFAFLGRLHATKGDYLVACQFYEKSIEIRINKYGEVHPYVIKCYDLVFKTYDAAISDMKDNMQKFNLALKCFTYCNRCIETKLKSEYLESAELTDYKKISEKVYMDMLKLISEGVLDYDKTVMGLIQEQYNNIKALTNVKIAS